MAKGKMAKAFGEASTTDEVLSGVNLKGKRVLVTGVSSGLGVETARSLAAHGAQVVGAARDLKKADAATHEVKIHNRQHGFCSTYTTATAENSITESSLFLAREKFRGIGMLIDKV